MSSTLPDVFARVTQRLPVRGPRRASESSAQAPAITLPKRPARVVQHNSRPVHSLSPAEAPYPLCYSRDVLDYDVWDHIFFKDLRGGTLTLHDFGDWPPKTVLDLGTGTGTWCLDAARSWKDCESIVGFDLVNIQPNVGRLGDPDLLKVRWVHGNILDSESWLMLPHNHFEFVRMSKVAMGIPENKWSFVIEMAVSVLKPGGVFEIIEDDILFPGAQFQPPPMRKEGSGSSKFSTISLGSTEWSNASATLVGSPPEFSRAIRTRLGLSSLHGAYESTPTLVDIEPPVESPDLADPRDHTILKSAFLAMLDVRFINPSPLSILPFYLSQHLDRVRAYAPLQFLLPPPSLSERPEATSTDARQVFQRYRSEESVVQGQRREFRTSTMMINVGASMHLAKTLATVLGCREAIWEQIQIMYDVTLEEFDHMMHNYEMFVQRTILGDRDN